VRANTYSGSYQTPYGAFQGWIQQQASGHIDFFLYGPSGEIQRHSHWDVLPVSERQLVSDPHGKTCERYISSGIITIETVD